MSWEARHHHQGIVLFEQVNDLQWNIFHEILYSPVNLHIVVKFPMLSAVKQQNCVILVLISEDGPSLVWAPGWKTEPLYRWISHCSVTAAFRIIRFSEYDFDPSLCWWDFPIWHFHMHVSCGKLPAPQGPSVRASVLFGFLTVCF